MTWLWLARAASADDLETVVATAVDGMTLDALQSGSSGALRLEIARFDAGDGAVSVRCEAFLGKSFSCELWSTAVDAPEAVPPRLLFGSAEALPCREGAASLLVADKPGIGRWRVTLPAELVPTGVALPTCESLRAPAAAPEPAKRRRR